MKHWVVNRDRVVWVAMAAAAVAQVGWCFTGAAWPVPVVSCPVLAAGWWRIRYGPRGPG